MGSIYRYYNITYVQNTGLQRKRPGAGCYISQCLTQNK